MDEKKKQKLIKAIDEGKIVDETTLGVFQMVTDLQDQVEEVVQNIKHTDINLDKVLESVKGKDGKQGIQGEKGDKGDRGEKGDSIIGKQGIKGEKGDKGDTGEKGDIGDTPDTTELVKQVEETIKPLIPKIEDIENNLPKLGTKIRDSLELLQGDERLDSTAIKGLSKREGKLTDSIINRAIGIVDQRTSFLINKVSALEARPTGGTSTGGGHVIEDEGTPLTQRTNLNFVGAGVTVTDDAGNDATKVTIGGGGSITGTDTHVLFFDGANNPAGDAGMTYNKTTDSLTVAGNIITPEVKAAGSAGVDIHNNSGTQVALFGAGGGTGTSIYGVVNIGNASADYIQIQGGTAVSTFTATGSSTDIDITSVPKGTGKFKVTGNVNISGLTASEIVITDASKNLVSAAVATYPSLTELSYIKGLTSSAQTQISAKPDFSFKTIAVSGQSDVVADSATDTLTLVAGSNVTITTNAGTDAITINSTGGGGTTTQYIDQTPDNGTYGALAGAVNSSNAVYTVSLGSYGTGTLQVYLNGVLQLQGASDDWQETTPASGTFTFNTAPTTGDIITAIYQNVAGATTGIVVKDEGSTLTSLLTSLDFVGAGVVATNTGGAVTVTIGGGGGGMTRSISSVSSPTTAGATASTDYVYLVTGTTTITLPTAVGNTNLYTVKRVGSNTVTIDTTSSQTIDGASTQTLLTQYESMSFLSDNTNWVIV